MDNAEKLNRVQKTIKDGQSRKTDNRVQMIIKDGQCRETEQGTKDNKRWTIQRN
jgi:hypothetical protein